MIWYRDGPLPETLGGIEGPLSSFGVDAREDHLASEGRGQRVGSAALQRKASTQADNMAGVQERLRRVNERLCPR